MKDSKDDAQSTKAEPRDSGPNDDADDEARRIILARRARFVAAALACAGIATAACGGETSGGEDSPYADGGANSGAGGAPQPCLQPSAGGAENYGGMPLPCLSPPQGGSYNYGGSPPIAGGAPGDAGEDATPTDAAPTDAGAPEPLDAGGLPVPCLSIPVPEGERGGGS
jgi:hypothetical protein